MKFTDKFGNIVECTVEEYNKINSSNTNNQNDRNEFGLKRIIGFHN